MPNPPHDLTPEPMDPNTGRVPRDDERDATRWTRTVGPTDADAPTRVGRSFAPPAPELDEPTRVGKRPRDLADPTVRQGSVGEITVPREMGVDEVPPHLAIAAIAELKTEVKTVPRPPPPGPAALKVVRLRSPSSRRRKAELQWTAAKSGLAGLAVAFALALGIGILVVALGLTQ